ncbi:TIGR02117 family protein [Rhizobium sp. RU36D]|uniref:TIGR02117 family protein n=1 Tax=Rhizobium sp. RU36D TaxID=1907415 RepID=UPI0009D7D3B9|nr:TIGR02117 family protein [Rhizobium sp. RU36D]SMC39630.1 conserved hypothetical protein [Rhizobium sp. RU36D]
MAFEVRRFARWMLGILAAAAIAAVVGTFTPRPFLAPADARSDYSYTIAVLSGAIHTDIAIPLDEVTRADFAFLAADGIPVDDPAIQWLVIGWGGREFYLNTPTWSELKAVPVLRALTVDRAVLRVDVASAIPADHPDIVPYEIGESRFRDLIAYVKDSFVLQNGVAVVVAGPGYGLHDRFYEAHGVFNALVGCNTWTAGALRTAGLRTGWWNPLPQSLNYSLRLFN